MDRIYLSKEELISIKEVYRDIMSYASIGLFLKNGEVIGEIITKNLPRESYFEDLKDILKSRGWVESIEFSEKEVRVKGSIEVHKSNFPHATY